MITLGQIIGVHGIKGWVKVKSYTRPEDNLFEFSQWSLVREQKVTAQDKVVCSVDDVMQQDTQCFWVKPVESRRQPNGWFVKLEGCDDRNAAELLRGLLVQVPRQQLPVLAEDEYYWSDLIGLAVEGLDGKNLGCVDSLIETGANDVLVVVDQDSKKRCLVPYLPKRVIKKIDISLGRMVVDWSVDKLDE